MIAVYNDAEWITDPAGGGKRWRAKMAEGELTVYGDDSVFAGMWEVRVRAQPQWPAAAGGNEGNEKAGKLRARAVYEAMTARLYEVEG